MIQVQNVSKIYRSRTREVRALDDFSLQVEDGEFVAVRGPSGSGKSTLLLTVGGMIRPTEGRVLTRDTDLYGLSRADRARFRANNLGFVFQMFHLAPYLNVLENVLLPTRLVPDGGKPELAHELLERFGMAERIHHKPGELSTGERQRTAIARALINKPWLLLADEPTGNLDPETGAEILDHLREFSQNGGTVIVVTHEPWVQERADRTVRIRQGQLEVE